MRLCWTWPLASCQATMIVPDAPARRDDVGLAGGIEDAAAEARGEAVDRGRGRDGAARRGDEEGHARSRRADARRVLHAGAEVDGDGVLAGDDGRGGLGDGRRGAPDHRDGRLAHLGDVLGGRRAAGRRRDRRRRNRRRRHVLVDARGRDASGQHADPEDDLRREVHQASSDASAAPVKVPTARPRSAPRRLYSAWRCGPPPRRGDASLHADDAPEAEPHERADDRHHPGAELTHQAHGVMAAVPE